MKQARILVCVVIGYCSIVYAGTQSASTGPLSPQMRAHLQTESLQIVTTIRGLPLGVREELQSLFGTADLDIANPGTEFQGSKPAGTPKLPGHRLIAAGCANDNHCLVYYERAGIPVTQRVMLFHWTPEETKFEWGGSAPGGFTSIEDVRKAVASGAIKGGEAGPW